MWQQFTENTRTAIFRSEDEAARLGGNVVWPEHLLLGLLKTESAAARDLLAARGATGQEILEALEPVVSRGPSYDRERDMQLHPKTKVVLEEAQREAERAWCKFIGTDHLLIALASTAGEPVASLFRTRSIDASVLRSAYGALHPPRPTATARSAASTTPGASYIRQPTAPESADGPVRVRAVAGNRRRAGRRVALITALILVFLLTLLVLFFLEAGG